MFQERASAALATDYAPPKRRWANHSPGESTRHDPISRQAGRRSIVLASLLAQESFQQFHHLSNGMEIDRVDLRRKDHIELLF